MAKKKSKTKLTMTSDRTKPEADKYDVSGFEETVVQIREIDSQMKELSESRNDLRGLIIDRVRILKEREEKKGNLFKTFVIASSDESPAVVLFKNAFSKIGVENEEVMRKELGPVFDRLYERKEQVSLKSKAKMDDLRKALGKRFSEFFDVKEHIAHKKNFMEMRADLRGEVSAKINAELDSYTKQCQSSPDLRMKG